MGKEDDCDFLLFSISRDATSSPLKEEQSRLVSQGAITNMDSYFIYLR